MARYFIGQEFGTSGTAINPAPGEWIVNSVAHERIDGRVGALPRLQLRER